MRLSLGWVAGSAFALLGCAADKFDVPDAAATDAAADTAAAETGQPGTVACKPTNCVTPAQACCLLSGVTDDACIARPASPSTNCPGPDGGSGTFLVMCDDSSDCAPDLVCCATPDNGAFFASACVTPIQCAGGKSRLCDPKIDSCPLNRTCSPYKVNPRYNACQ